MLHLVEIQSIHHVGHIGYVLYSELTRLVIWVSMDIGLELEVILEIWIRAGLAFLGVVK